IVSGENFKSLTFDIAEKECEKEQSHLVSVHSAKERDYITDLIRRMHVMKYGRILSMKESMKEENHVWVMIGLFTRALPYTVYLTANWNPTHLDMDPYYVLILGTPLVVQLKINLTLTIAIALERTLANRTSAGILLTSLMFVTIPSVGVGFVEMLGYSIFRAVGPFYSVGLLCAGACNSIVYVVLNRDMRNLAKQCLNGKSTNPISSPAHTRITTNLEQARRLQRMQQFLPIESYLE
ncbi:hypothetical protein OSTOST_06478, partial [Ostertagia ostertagi]